MDENNELITDDFEEAAIWFSKLSDEDKKLYLEKIAKNLVTASEFKRSQMEVLFKENNDGKVEIVGIFDKNK